MFQFFGVKFTQPENISEKSVTFETSNVLTSMLVNAEFQNMRLISVTAEVFRFSSPVSAPSSTPLNQRCRETGLLLSGSPVRVSGRLVQQCFDLLGNGRRAAENVTLAHFCGIRLDEFGDAVI